MEHSATVVVAYLSVFRLVQRHQNDPLQFTWSLALFLPLKWSLRSSTTSSFCTFNTSSKCLFHHANTTRSSAEAVTMNGHALEEVGSSYLGSEVEQIARVKRDVGIRMEKAATVYRMWRWKVFRSQYLSKTTKVCVRFDQWSCQSSSTLWIPG